MKPYFWLDQIPLWGVFFITGALVLASIRTGIFFGRRRGRNPDHMTDASLGSIVTAILGLLAFLLAFSFAIAAERFQTRRQFLLDEVLAIGTTYLRAEMLSEPHRSEIRKLLREYVDVRVNLAKDNLQKKTPNIQEAVSRSESLQNQIWSHAVALADTDHSSVINALFINSLNNMIDLHTSRLTALNYRTPPILWYILYFITIISMAAVGYQFGLTGKKDIIGGIFLALTFSAVIYLIMDLDRVIEGHIQLSQRPMFELQKQMQMPMQEANPTEKTVTSTNK
jgi:hypothetical protein